MAYNDKNRSLVPAIRRGTEVVVGKPGDSHDDVISTLRDFPKASFDRSIDRGFFTEHGTFLRRVEAMSYARIHGLLREDVEAWEDELHSNHLT